MQLVPGKQSLFAWHDGPGERRHAILAVGFGMKPDGQEQEARWLMTVHFEFGPHGVTSQGVAHLFPRQASFALQSSSARQPKVHMLCKQM